MKKLRVTVEGKAYEVLVEFLDEPIPGTAPAAPPPAVSSVTSVLAAPVAPAPAQPAGTAAQAGDIPSPLAGKLVSIDVQVGQVVAEGAQVATVEAMKMNTHIFAPRAGTVAAVLATAGSSVEEGTGLVRLA